LNSDLSWVSIGVIEPEVKVPRYGNVP